MSRRLGELCSLFVEAAFGGLAAQIFSCLADHGRLTFVALRAAMQGMPMLYLKRSLIPLIQHHLIFHHAAYDDEPTFFSVDWEAAYLLVRTRKFLDIIEQLEGETAGHIVATILNLGHANIRHIADEYDKTKTSASKRDSGIEIVEKIPEEYSTEDDKDEAEEIAEENSTKEDSVNGEEDFVEEDAEELEDETPKSPILDLDVNTLHKTLRTLLNRGILVKVTERTYIPHDDLDARVRDTVQLEKFPDGKIKGSKKSKEFMKEVNALKRKYHEEDAYNEKRDIGSHGEIKRSDPDAPSSKRLKTSATTNGVPGNGEVQTNGEINGLAHNDGDLSIDKLPNDMVVRVNFPKSTTLLRNQSLVSTVEQVLGSASAAVYAALLRALEAVDPPIHEGLRVKGERQEIKDEDDSDDEAEEDNGNNDEETDDLLPKVKDADVLEYLTMSTADLAAGMKEVISVDDLPNGIVNHNDDEDVAELSIKKESKTDDENDEDDEDPIKATTRRLKDRNMRLRLVDHYLGILAEHSRKFCTHDSQTHETKVDFAPIGRAFVAAELDAVIHARAGKLASRIIGLFRHKGKLDDFQIARVTLQKPEVVQLKLTELHNAGFIRIQEVPKDNTRQPNRSIYLYYYDEEMVRGRLLDLTYQAMGRCLMRLNNEKLTRFAGALEKAEYVDASLEDPEGQQGLSKLDTKTLKKWREVEDAMSVQVQRLDDFVLIMRDIGGTDKSLLM